MARPRPPLIPHDAGVADLRVLAAPAVMPPDGNPYITALYSAVRANGVQVDDLNRRALAQRYDIVHVHWPELIVRWADRRTAITDATKVLALLWIARRRGARLVWTGHDLGPHDMPHPRMYRAYIAAFTRMVDLLISLGPSATERLLSTYPALRGKPVRVIRHGHYRDDYPLPPSRDAARAALGLPADGPLLLLLGQIRRYKNVPALIDAFASRPAGKTHLAVAGQLRGDLSLEQEVRDAAANSEAVTARLGLVPTDDIPSWHAAANVVVLPYSQATSLHSGAALLALSMNRPVVVPDSGTMRELRELAGPNWVYLFDGDTCEALDAAERALADQRPATVDLSALDWDSLGKQTVQAYQDVGTAHCP